VLESGEGGELKAYVTSYGDLVRGMKGVYLVPESGEIKRGLVRKLRFWESLGFSAFS
jgi:hypothetical protein